MTRSGVLVLAVVLGPPVSTGAHAGALTPLVLTTIGVFRPNWPAPNNAFLLRNKNTLAPPANSIAGFGNSGDLPIVGDWNGDGIETIGVLRPNYPAGLNTFYLRNTNSLGIQDILIKGIGVNGDVPIVGDWDGNGTTTIGLFRPDSPPGSNSIFLWNSNTNPPGPPDITIIGIGQSGDLPVAGDWDGNGTTTIGLFRPNSPAGTNTFFLWNANAYGQPDIIIQLGITGDKPIVGDWDGNHVTTIGLFRPNVPAGSNTFFRWNSSASGAPDIVFGYGAVGDQPMAGKFGNTPPIINRAIFGLPANSPSGTYIGTVTASDPDNPDAAQTLTFSFFGTGTDDFVIDPTTGQITVKNSNPPCFCLLGVSVTDNGMPPFADYTVIEVVLPLVLTAGGTLNYTKNDPATAIDTTVTVSDPSTPTVVGATVQITSNCANTQDVLSFTTQNGISGVYTAASCLMTLSGSGTLANYQSALRSVKYNNTSENPSTLSRTVTWIGNDGYVSSTPVTSTINVTAVNGAPYNLR